METNKPLDSPDLQDTDQLFLSNRSQGYLEETAKWSRFLAILGFVMLGLGFLVTLGVLLFASGMSRAYGAMGLGSGIGALFGFIIVAAIYYFPLIYLLRFANGMRSALRENDQARLDEALMNIKSHYKFIGILAIVLLILYGVGLLINLLLFGGMLMNMS